MMMLMFTRPGSLMTRVVHVTYGCQQCTAHTNVDWLDGRGTRLMSLDGRVGRRDDVGRYFEH